MLTLCLSPLHRPEALDNQEHLGNSNLRYCSSRCSKSFVGPCDLVKDPPNSRQPLVQASQLCPLFLAWNLSQNNRDPGNEASFLTKLCHFAPSPPGGGLRLRKNTFSPLPLLRSSPRLCRRSFRVTRPRPAGLLRASGPERPLDFSSPRQTGYQLGTVWKEFFCLSSFGKVFLLFNAQLDTSESFWHTGKMWSWAGMEHILHLFHHFVGNPKHLGYPKWTSPTTSFSVTACCLGPILTLTAPHWTGRGRCNGCKWKTCILFLSTRQAPWTGKYSAKSQRFSSKELELYIILYRLFRLQNSD